MRRATARREDGFTVLEVLIAVVLVTIVMSAMVGFLTTTTAVLALQRDRQTAIQLADDAMEQVRATSAAVLPTGRAAGAATPPVAPGVSLTGMVEWDKPGTGTAAVPLSTTRGPIAGVTYRQYAYLGICYQPAASGTVSCTTTKPSQTTPYAQFYRVVVAITWTNRHCTGGTCSYVTSTLVSCGTWKSSGSDACAADEPVFRVIS